MNVLKNRNPSILFITLFLLISCSTSKNTPEVITDFNLEKYTGTWYEIARLPNRFEKDLDCITANYSLLPKGKIKVENKGLLKNDHSKSKSATGKAYIPDTLTKSKIKVTFFWPFYADYWVLAIDKEYQNVLVGSPDYQYLWLLSRTDTMEINTYNTLVNIALKKGYNVSELIRVNQTK